MTILVVSPHPDDETLGAGGTLLKMRKKGNIISWLNITDMKTEYGWSEDEIAHRQKQIEQILGFYKFDKFYNLGYPPTGLSSMKECDIINSIKRVFEEVKPEWIIIPGAYDAHSDHRVVYNCCMACAKPFRAPYIKRITAMEIVSETEYGYQTETFSPNMFIDISEEIDDKITAMTIYDTEIKNAPFPRCEENIRALAKTRGMFCAIMYAEAFMLIRQIE